ncbi:MAG: hypothetical protein RIF46_01685, partial [Cyclobacteriaceae bacterium]
IRRIMESSTRNVLSGVLVVTLAGGILLSAQNPGDQYKVYYGLLHAHTAISDGSGTPEEAYTMAKEYDLDFFAVTPHNHAAAESGAKDRKDGVLIADNWNLYNGNTIQTVTQTFSNGSTNELKVKPLLMAANEATSPDFLPIYGQEFSTISSSNHMNVLGIDEVIRVGDGNVTALVDLLDQQEEKPILQLNHPDVQSDLFYEGRSESTKKKMFNDYGIDDGDLGPHFSNMVKKLDPYVHLIEMFSGPAMQKTRIENYHDDHTHHNDYFFYLSQGFHISPTAGQDNHYKTWGMATDIRTGIFAKSLSRADVFDAFRGQRTFASEDANARISVSINGAFMGSNLDAEPETSLKIEIRLDDTDEPDEEVEFAIFGGLVEPQDSRKATNHKQRNNDLTDGTIKTGERKIVLEQLTSGNPEFYYVYIRQQDGDRIYSGPVWVNYPKAYAMQDQADVDATAQAYVWTKSKSSEVYHLEGCPSTRMIKDANRVSGVTPPEGRRLHECPVDEEGEH